MDIDNMLQSGLSPERVQELKKSLLTDIAYYVGSSWDGLHARAGLIAKVAAIRAIKSGDDPDKIEDEINAEFDKLREQREEAVRKIVEEEVAGLLADSLRFSEEDEGGGEEGEEGEEFSEKPIPPPPPPPSEW